MIQVWQPKYIDPFTDYGFKILFGQQRNKKILISFLNALLGGKKVIKDLIYLDKEHLGLSAANRKSIFDVYCEDENGARFVIEIQRELLLFFNNRALYYSAYPILEQGIKGKWNHQLKEVFHIWIVDHLLPDSDPDKMVHEIKLMNTQSGKVFDNSLTYLFIEAPKFNKQESELETPFDQWMYVFTNLSRLQEIPVTLQDDPIFKEFFMIAELLKMTPEERGIYLASLKEEWDAYSLQETIMVRGMEKGMAQGMEKGIEKGIEMGIAKGKEEGQREEQRKIAFEMKRLGVSLEIISKSTGFKFEEIESL